MSREKLAGTYEELAALHNKLAEAYAQVAFDLMGPAEQPDAPPSVRPVATGGASPVAQSPVDQGECPKHHRAWKLGTYGPYCTAQTDDPAWGKPKPDGKMFCKITPTNAPEWLRIHGAAAA